MKHILKGRIGNVAMVIEAEAEAPTLIAIAAMKQVAYHDAASEAFKVKSAYKRDSAYSAELANFVIAIVTAKIVALGFADVSIKTEAYIAETDESKNRKYWASQGFDAAFADSMWAIAQEQKLKANAAIVAKPAEVSL